MKSKAFASIGESAATLGKVKASLSSSLRSSEGLADETAAAAKQKKITDANLAALCASFASASASAQASKKMKADSKDSTTPITGKRRKGVEGDGNAKPNPAKAAKPNKPKANLTPSKQASKQVSTDWADHCH